MSDPSGLNRGQLNIHLHNVTLCGSKVWSFLDELQERTGPRSLPSLRRTSKDKNTIKLDDVPNLLDGDGLALQPFLRERLVKTVPASAWKGPLPTMGVKPY